jgi:integrase
MPPPPLPPGHSVPHVNCPLCEDNRLETIQPEAFGLLRFSIAAPYWLREHQLEIAEKTHFDYKYYLRSLTSFFGELPLKEIHVGHVRQYQTWRQQPYKDANNRTRSAGPSAINHEINTLAQILDRAGLWTEIDRWYRPLHLPESRVGKALTQEEEERLFYVASAGGRWEVANLAGLLSVNTTTGPGEIRHLRIRDIDLTRKKPDGTPMPSLSVVEGLKNEFRERTIPLNATAEEAVRLLLKRYQRLLKKQGVEPDREHYLLPGRARRGRNQVDFFKPQGSWNKAWTAIRERAGLKHVRRYDMRGHAITKMLENPANSEQVVQEVAGHVSKRMMDHYSHIRDARKRGALDSVETKAPPKQLQLEFGFGKPVESIPPSNVVEFVERRKFGNK